MSTKLTLTIDESVIKKAKLYAKKQGRSLSDIVENLLKMITADKEKEADTTPLVESLRGSFKAPESADYDKALSDILHRKYMK